jgi:hypothetical protein
MNTRRLARWAGAFMLAGGLASTGQALAQPGPAVPADPQSILLSQPSTTCALPCLVNQPSTSPPTNTDATAFPGFSSQAADDFVVTNLFWHITSVIAVGQDVAAGGSGVSSVLVQFYSDSGGGLPAATPLYSKSYPSSSYTDTIVVPLNPIAILGPGHYWFSVQPQVTCTASNCQGWNWNESPLQPNTAESAWKNPDGTLNSNCTNWQPRVTKCGRPFTSSGKDLAFELDGTTAAVVGRVLLPLVRR